MNKSLVKALHELHERGITENECKHLQIYLVDEWRDCQRIDVTLASNCTYRIKPRTITIELTEEQAVCLLSDVHDGILEFETYRETDNAIAKIRQALEQLI